MAAAEAMSVGAWTRLFNDAHPERFSEPTVVGVDFPTLALRQAYWDRDRRRLLLGTSPQNQAVTGRPTSFRIRHLDRAEEWTVEIDGLPAVSRWLPDGDLRIDLPVARSRVEVFPSREKGNHDGPIAAHREA